MIKIVCLGKLKETYLKEAVVDYVSRINKYHKIEIIELKDDPDIIKEESQMLKYLYPNNFNICLDIYGDKVSSTKLSDIIDKGLMTHGNITFFVGASNGVSDMVKNKCNLLISFGDITMPHGIFRLVLCEQIYRGFKILNHESYHK